MTKKKQKLSRKVAVIGCAWDWWSNAVETMEDFEFWTLNNCGVGISRDPDRLYELHSKDQLASPDRDRDPRHGEWAEQFKTAEQVWSLHPRKELGPRVKAFPLEELIRWCPRPYFTNSVAWMVAHALYEGVSELFIAGMNMDSPSEWMDQKACLEYWIGYAEGQRVKVTVSPDSQIGKSSYLYGLQDPALQRAVTTKRLLAYAAMVFKRESE
jgi:hypothetical protein